MLRLQSCLATGSASTVWEPFDEIIDLEVRRLPSCPTNLAQRNQPQKGERILGDELLVAFPSLPGLLALTHRNARDLIAFFEECQVRRNNGVCSGRNLDLVPHNRASHRRTIEQPNRRRTVPNALKPTRKVSSSDKTRLASGDLGQGGADP